MQRMEVSCAVIRRQMVKGLITSSVINCRSAIVGNKEYANQITKSVSLVLDEGRTPVTQ